MKGILFCQIWEENHIAGTGHGFWGLPEHEEEFHVWLIKEVISKGTNPQSSE